MFHVKHCFNVLVTIIEHIADRSYYTWYGFSGQRNIENNTEILTSCIVYIIFIILIFL